MPRLQSTARQSPALAQYSLRPSKSVTRDVVPDASSPLSAVSSFRSLSVCRNPCSCKKTGGHATLASVSYTCMVSYTCVVSYTCGVSYVCECLVELLSFSSNPSVFVTYCSTEERKRMIGLEKNGHCVASESVNEQASRWN
jgi:hypothetical protein